MDLWWNESNAKLTFSQSKRIGRRYLQIGYRKHSGAEQKLVLSVANALGKVIARAAFPHTEHVAEVRMYEETYAIDVRMFNRKSEQSDVSTRRGIWLPDQLTMPTDGVQMDVSTWGESRRTGCKAGIPPRDPHPRGK